MVSLLPTNYKNLTKFLHLFSPHVLFQNGDGAYLIGWEWTLNESVGGVAGSVTDISQLPKNVSLTEHKEVCSMF